MREYVYFDKTVPRPKRTPPPRQATLLAFIKSEIANGRAFPTQARIARHMGWKNTTSATDALLGLVRDGHVILRRTGRVSIWELVGEAAE